MAGGAELPRSKISDEDRTELMKKMDKDLAEHFAKLEAKARERGPRTQFVDGFTEETWEQEMANHPFFKKEFSDGEELSPLMQGLQDLKYSPDENTPEELAKNYKEDGNFNFKCKKYRFAVASYTEGLKAKCTDLEVNTQLLTNRAAAQFHIGNYRSSLLDCQMALRFTPDHMKVSSDLISSSVRYLLQTAKGRRSKLKSWDLNNSALNTDYGFIVHIFNFIHFIIVGNIIEIWLN